MNDYYATAAGAAERLLTPRRQQTKKFRPTPILIDQSVTTFNISPTVLQAVVHVCISDEGLSKISNIRHVGVTCQRYEGV